jgi:cysteine-rich repeat protein
MRAALLLLLNGCIITSDDTSARCGDGILDSGEQCDDGNNVSGDGCSATCQTELDAGVQAPKRRKHPSVLGSYP